MAPRQVDHVLKLVDDGPLEPRLARTQGVQVDVDHLAFVGAGIDAPGIGIGTGKVRCDAGHIAEEEDDAGVAVYAGPGLRPKYLRISG